MSIGAYGNCLRPVAADVRRRISPQDRTLLRLLTLTPAIFQTRSMKNFVETVALIGALLPSLTLAGENKIQPSKNLISLYQAQLVCPAAPQIGCGSAAKPILLELERDPHVSEAWLNRPGTTIAIVWKERTASRKRAKIVQAVLNEPKVHELKGSAREQALQTFLAGRDWYRGAEVDRLSEEEAAINAGKLVRKIRELISLTDAKASTLQHEFTAVLARKLTQGGSREETEAALMKICPQHLEEKDIATLHEAYQRGAFSHLTR